MSTETLIRRSGGKTIHELWFDVLRGALSSHFLPRNASGVPTDEAGFLGSPALRWLKAYIASGEWTTGDIKVCHSYNGATHPGEGWMLCDGRTIGQTAYDVEHGAGAWSAYVGTSLLNGKKLPDFTNRFPVGKATTTQDGSSPITSVGSSAAVNLQHFHKWYNHAASSLTSDSSFDSAGNLQVVNAGGSAKNAGFFGLVTTTNQPAPAASMYTDKQLSATQSLVPESIETLYYMRVV